LLPSAWQQTGKQGEVVSAVRAASKLLHELGLSWTELADAIELGLSNDPSKTRKTCNGSPFLRRYLFSIYYAES
jgi:hypothetical protein